jgi:centromere protein J
MKLPNEYHSTSQQNTTVKDQIVGNDGKIQRTYLSGKKEVIFSNGVKRETFPDGYTIVYFNNSDVK